MEWICPAVAQAYKCHVNINLKFLCQCEISSLQTLQSYWYQSYSYLMNHLFQINAQETTYREASDIYDVRGVTLTLTGVPQNFTHKLPVRQFDSGKMLKLYNESCCSICFQVRKIHEPFENAQVLESKKQVELVFCVTNI